MSSKIGMMNPIVIEAYSYKHKLSPHFTYGEMIKSNTATRDGIDNEPNEEQLKNLRFLCENVLEKVRVGLKRAVLIGSGFRCKELNEKIGGSSRSQHCFGEAADFDVSGYTTTEVFEWIILKSDIIWDQIIWEFGDNGWIHISCKRSSGNRMRITTAKKKQGKTIYEHWTKEQVVQGGIYS